MHHCLSDHGQNWESPRVCYNVVSPCSQVAFSAGMFSLFQQTACRQHCQAFRQDLYRIAFSGGLRLLSLVAQA